MKDWEGMADAPGLDFHPIMKGIDLDAWEDDEESSLLSMATMLLTDWSTTIAINHLMAKNLLINDWLKLLEAAGQLTTPTPEVESEAHLETSSLQEPED